MLLDVDEHPVRKAALTGQAVKAQLVSVKSPSSSELKWMLISAEPVYQHGRIDAIICTYQDVTKLKESEEALRESEERFRGIVETAEEGIATLNVDGIITYVNEQMADMLGYSREEMINRPSLDFVHEDGKEAVINASIYLQEHGSLSAERKLRCKDGTVLWTLVNATPRRDSTGKYVGYIALHTDVTHRKVVEQQREELLNREKHIAKVLQEAILPPKVPSEILGYRMAVSFKPALREAEIGGDFFDVFELEGNRLAVVIGDVVGKGLNAALRVASVRHSIRSYAYLDPRPSKILSLTNQALCRENGDASNMLTAFLAILDSEGGTFSYCSAGHEPPLVRSGSGECIELELEGSMALGVLGTAEYLQYTRRLDPGDVVVLVTDGITEARAPGTVLFGKDRLIEYVRKSGDTSPEIIAAEIMDLATTHAGGQLQDDAAVVIFTPDQKETA